MKTLIVFLFSFVSLNSYSQSGTIYIVNNINLGSFNNNFCSFLTDSILKTSKENLDIIKEITKDTASKKIVKLTLYSPTSKINYTDYKYHDTLIPNEGTLIIYDYLGMTPTDYTNDCYKDVFIKIDKSKIIEFYVFYGGLNKRTVSHLTYRDYLLNLKKGD